MRRLLRSLDAQDTVGGKLKTEDTIVGAQFVQKYMV